MKNKNLVRKTSVLFAVCMIFIGGAIPSFANNYKNTSFQFNFGLLNGSRYTPGRAKKDSSKSYMHCETITKGYSYEGKVYASTKLKNELLRFDCSGGNSYPFKKGVDSYMTNYVKEKGFTAATIKANAGVNSREVIATGRWSPDNYRKIQG